MNAPPGTTVWSGLASLRRYADGPARASAERCDLCGVAIDAEHGHLANTVSRQLLCACRACHLLFAHDGAGGSRFRAVPDRVLRLDAGDFDDRHWASLDIPTGIAFFLRSGATGRITAFYPSPAGATESELPLDAWAALGSTPALESLASDVEAVLVRRRTTSPGDGGDAGQTTALIVPIDVCYELTGLLRQHWRGFQGGDDVWREIDAWFAGILARARPASTVDASDTAAVGSEAP